MTTTADGGGAEIHDAPLEWRTLCCSHLDGKQLEAESDATGAPHPIGAAECPSMLGSGRRAGLSAAVRVAAIAAGRSWLVVPPPLSEVHHYHSKRSIIPRFGSAVPCGHAGSTAIGGNDIARTAASNCSFIIDHCIPSVSRAKSVGRPARPDISRPAQRACDGCRSVLAA